MACGLTTSFLKNCSSNTAGGIKLVYVAPFSAKGNLQIVSGSVANTGSFLTTGSQFFTYEPRKQTAEAEDLPKVNEQNGSTYQEQTVSLVINSKDVIARNEIERLTQQSVMVITKDNANVYRLFGSDNGLEFLAGGYQTGKVSADLNGYNITFGPGQEGYQALFVSSSLMTALTTPA